MKVYSWNVNGVRSSWSKGLSDLYYKTNPDILCLQEIKAREDQFPDEMKTDSLFKTRTHHLYTCCAKKPGYAGVAVLTKEKPQNVVTELGHDRFDSEGRMLRLDFPEFSLFNFYIPHGGRQKENLAYKLEVYDFILKELDKMKEEKVILVGDFNIAHDKRDLDRPKQNINNIMYTVKERQILDKLILLGFVDTLREFHSEGGLYSWWPYMAGARERNLGWRIDYGFVSKNLKPKLKDAYTCPEVLGSDHGPIGLDIF